MAQDFAKQRPAAPTQRKATRVPPRPAKRSHWSWYFSGMMSGALAVVVAYYGFLRYEALMQETPEGDVLAEAQDQQPAVQYGFYRQLATAEVNVDVPVVAKAAEPTAATNARGTDANDDAQTVVAEASTASFLLQAGSFQDRQDAEGRRAKIILLNMDAQISAGVVSGRTWYRVQVGPFNSRRSAEEARNLLSASNIDSIPLLMR